MVAAFIGVLIPSSPPVASSGMCAVANVVSMGEADMFFDCSVVGRILLSSTR